jgi:hypothetical protein
MGFGLITGFIGHLQLLIIITQSKRDQGRNWLLKCKKAPGIDKITPDVMKELPERDWSCQNTYLMLC